MAELIPLRYSNSKLNVIIARPFNHIGPGQRAEFVVSSFAQQLAKIKLGKQEPVISVGNLDAKRDFCDVRDIVRGYRLAAEKGRGVYNFCSGHPVAISDVLNQLITISGCQVEIKQSPDRMRTSDIPENYGSLAKINSELGWKPEIELRTSLVDCYNYWIKSFSLE
jgi:GDP-4-dehydro-6-deoxy-D-mannose reductase